MSQTYKTYSFADHKEVYLKLEQTFKAFGVHYYLIGANARDVQLYKAGAKPNRGTSDIDFAVMLPDMKTYQKLRNALKEKGFEDTNGGMPYRMYYPESNTVIDLLPYGQIAQEYTVQFPDRKIELSVLGMQEVGESTENFDHPEGFSLPVTPLHGMVILKLIAWSERPHQRDKDLKDISNLLDAAWEIYEDELHTKNSPHDDLFDAEDFDTKQTAARVLGRKIQQTLKENKGILSKIKDILKTELDEEAGTMARQLVTEHYETVAELKKILNAIYVGMKDEIM